jgi:hypothetical protein
LAETIHAAEGRTGGKTVNPVQKVIAALSVVCIFLGCLLVYSAYQAYQSFLTVHNTASIKFFNIKGYEDANRTKPLKSIDWGVMYPSMNKTFSFYLWNDGARSINVTSRTENWMPPQAAQYLSLRFSLEGAIMYANEYRAASLTLTLSPDIPQTTNITAFSFDIIVRGVQL